MAYSTSDKKKSVLIIQTAFIGDVVLATPLVEWLAEHRPDWKVDFLVRKGNEGLLHGHPHLRSVLIWDKKNVKYRDFWRVLKQIRQNRYDFIFNCHRFASSGFLTVFGNSKRTFGFSKNPFSLFFSKKYPHHIGNGTHEVERNLSLLSEINNGEIPSLLRPKLYPNAADFKTIQPYLQHGPFVCIAPTSVWFTKQWPLEKWGALIESFSLEKKVYLLGGPTDFDVCEALKSLVQSTISIQNLAGKLSFLSSAALMSKAEMNYVNDSAPLHFASAMNAPVIAIFCSTSPDFGFTPLSDVHLIWENKENLPCRPCGLHGKKRCPEGHFRCAEV